jgi:hypothetical protein
MTKTQQVKLMTLLGGAGGAYRAWESETSGLGWKIATSLIYGAVSGLWWWYLVSGVRSSRSFKKPNDSRRKNDDL